MKHLITIIILVAIGAVGWNLFGPQQDTLDISNRDDSSTVNTPSDNNISEREVADFSENNRDDDRELRETIEEQREEEPFPAAEAFVTPSQPAPQPAIAPVTQPKPVVSDPLPPAPEPTPVATSLSGTFSGSESYNASGQVSISGNQISINNLDSSRIPDGFIYLSNSLSDEGGVRVARMTGSSGNQSYSLPDGVNASDYKYVLIWCRAFSVLVGSAQIN